MNVGFDAMMQRLTVVFGRPAVPKENLAAHAAEWRHALGGYAPDILREATDRVIRGRRYRTWPTIGDLTHAAEAVAAELRVASERAAQAAQQRQESVPKAPPSPEAAAEADRLVAEVLARMPKADGVVGGVSAAEWEAGRADRWYADQERQARARRLAALDREQRREEQRWRKEARRGLPRQRRARRQPLH